MSMKNCITVILIFILTILNIDVSFSYESSDIVLASDDVCNDIELSISLSDNILTENNDDCNDLISPNYEAESNEEVYVGLFEDTYSGTCGDNAEWNLDINTGVMTISGSGDMEDYENVLSTPWYSYKSFITKVNMDSGITSLGSYAFCACYSLENISFSNS